MRHIKKTLIVTSIISIFSMGAASQEIPESLVKKENIDQIKNQEKQNEIENKPAEEERIIIENKPVEQIPATKENREKLKEETKMEKNTRLAINFSYKLKEYNVNTCYEPLNQLVRSFAQSPNLKDLELRSTLIESDKTEPVVFMDYAITAKQEPQYSSNNLSLQAIPYEDKNTCLLIETKDTILNNVESCEPLLAEADNADNPAFINEGTFANPFDKNKHFRKFNNQMLTLNDIKEGGCHVRSISYSQYININPKTENNKTDELLEQDDQR